MHEHGTSGRPRRDANTGTPAAQLAATIEHANSDLPNQAPTVPFEPRAETIAFSHNAQDRAGQPEQPTIANYEILGELGRGGMGVVYRARQKGLNRIVAIKILLSGEHAGSEHHARFQTEAQAVARLQHPHIVQIYEIGEYTGLPFLSLEFVPGGSLAHKIAGKPQHAGDSARLVETIARAIQVVHNLGIVHRDLKPANILLAFSDPSTTEILADPSQKNGLRDGQLHNAIPKVNDFGLAKLLELNSQQTRSGAIMGSPSYMAPEQARGESKEVGPLADVYAIGAILYELMTGRPPFLAATAVDTLQQVVQSDPVPPTRLEPNAPRDLETICLKCLQKEPAKRYATAESLAEDLRRFRQGEPILARPVSGFERLRRWCRRNPGIALASATAIGLLISTAIISLWFALTLQAKNKIIGDEREVALAAKMLAQHKAEIADANAKTATEQSTLAVKTIQKLILVVQQRLSEAPQTWEARKAVLMIAADGLQQVADKVDTSTSIEITEWALLLQNGVLLKQIGEWGKAHEHFTKALDIARQRVVIKNNSDSSRTNLARSLRELAEATLEVDRDLLKSLAYYREALGVRQSILDHPNPGDGNAAIPFIVRAELAEDESRVGATIYRQGDPAQAAPHFRNAYDILQELVATHATDPGIAKLDPQQRPRRNDLEQGLIRALLALGEMSFRLRDPQAANDLYRSGVERRETLLAENPGNVEFKLECARAHGNFGDIILHSGDLTRAQEHYERARSLLEQLVAVDSHATAWQRNLGLAFYRLGNLALRMQEADSAREQFEESRKIRQSLADRSPESDRRQMELMVALAHCGELEQATRLAEKYAQSDTVDNEMLLDLSRCFAQCAAAAASDGTDMQVQYGQRAIDAIAKATFRGYRDAVYLEFEPDLDPIRNHAAFIQILDRVRAAQ